MFSILLAVLTVSIFWLLFYRLSYLQRISHISVESTLLSSKNISINISINVSKHINKNISSFTVDSKMADKCFENVIKRIEESHKKYLDEIINISTYFNLNKIKFYFLDWKNKTDPLWNNKSIHDKASYSVGLWAEERFYLLSNHINRVYNINDANIIIFGYDTADELLNYPCYEKSMGTRMDFSNFTNYPDNISIISRTKQYPILSFHDTLNNWLYDIIIKHIINNYHNIPIFIYDRVASAECRYFNIFLNKTETDKNLSIEEKNVINTSINKNIIVGKFSFIDPYRNNSDIQLAPPIMKPYYNQHNISCIEKQKYLYSFCGNLERKTSFPRLHFNKLWMKFNPFKYRNVRVVNTGEKGKNKCNNYDELMINSTFLLIFSGDGLWSYRFTEALLTYNILILIGMDDYIMPYENIIDYNKWYKNYGIIRIDHNTFKNISNRQQFEEQVIPKLTDQQICNARLYNKKMVDLHFKDTISEINTMLLSLQQRIS